MCIELRIFACGGVGDTPGTVESACVASIRSYSSVLLMPCVKPCISHHPPNPRWWSNYVHLPASKHHRIPRCHLGTNCLPQAGPLPPTRHPQVLTPSPCQFAWYSFQSMKSVVTWRIRAPMTSGRREKAPTKSQCRELQHVLAEPRFRGGKDECGVDILDTCVAGVTNHQSLWEAARGPLTIPSVARDSRVLD